jgi:alpha-amylase
VTDVVCYFQAHQPFRLRPGRHERGEPQQRWFDDELNRLVVERVAERCYRPMNALLLELGKRHEGRFRVGLSVTGTLLDQLRRWSPATLDSFVALAESGCVEFLGETSHHSVSALACEAEFRDQVETHARTIEELFGRRPTTFRNTELIIREDIARIVEELGFEVLLGEGADRLLGWRLPFWPYRPKGCTSLKLLLRCYSLSDDIGFRFSNRQWPEYPLFADKFARWMHGVSSDAAFVGLFMDYETFGEHQWADTGILEFMKQMPGEVLKDERFTFRSPGESAARHAVVGELAIQDAVSWADAERDVSAWLGNPMQRHAHAELYALRDEVLRAATLGRGDLLDAWRRMTTSDHVYYMATKSASDNDVHEYFSPYGRPHDAFMTFSNVLDDLRSRVRAALASPADAARPVTALTGDARSTTVAVPPSPSTPDRGRTSPAPPQAPVTRHPEPPSKPDRDTDRKRRRPS